LREVAKENFIHDAIVRIAQKNNLTEQECRDILRKSIKELSQAQLIYSGEKMLVKVVEVKNG